jgi:hypothetical protein
MTHALPIAKPQSPDLPVRGRGIGHAIGAWQRMVGEAAFGGSAAT